jgi:hypothetical protein
MYLAPEQSTKTGEELWEMINSHGDLLVHLMLCSLISVELRHATYLLPTEELELCVRLQDSSKRYISFTEATTRIQGRPVDRASASKLTEAREDKVVKRQAFIMKWK